MSAPLATVGVLSIGSMGLGVAKLLKAHNYRVLTNVANRSSATQKRAQNAQLDLVPTDTELVATADYILSIVPPRDALATAERIIKALNTDPPPRSASLPPLYFLDLNAIAPSTATNIASVFEKQAPNVRFVDGGIIGGPPSPIEGSSEWKKPGIPLSGPYPLPEAPTSGLHLTETLHGRHIGPNIGSASGLKCCFASLTKGFTALALQSFSTASSLGVLPYFEDYLAEYNPRGKEQAARGIVGCPSKAYRWVEEMRQIGQTFEVDGGWGAQAQVFRQIADVYDVLGKVVDERGGTHGMADADSAVEVLQGSLKGKTNGTIPVEALEQADR